MKLSHTMAVAIVTMAFTTIVTIPTSAHGRYGGSFYTGKPMLNVTTSVVKAGGGPLRFSTARAVMDMVGARLAQKEVAKLTKQHGSDKVASWIKISDFVVMDAIKLATKAGIKLPKGNLKGKELASSLVMLGLEKDHTFNIELLLDKMVTHKIHEQVMEDIDKKFGAKANADYHRISNQAYYDLAQALGIKKVKLNKFH